MSQVNHIQQPDTFEEFEKWLGNFLERNKGYCPHNIKKWWTKVEASHTNIRQKLGGVRKEYLFDIKSQQTPASKKDVDPIADEILRLVPGYLEGYQLTRDVFLLPTITQGTHSAFKLTKHIKGYADQLYKQGVLSELNYKGLEKPLSKLGEVWAKAKTSEIQLEATISTSAKAFVLLGHYGPDPDSCFRNGSDKTRDKFVLGQSPDTFVISISKKKENKDKFVNVSRCFGFLSSNYSQTCLNTMNYYATPGFAEGDGIEVLKRIASDILQDEVELHENIVEVTEGYVFQNPYGRWSFSKGKNSRMSRIPYTPDINHIKKFDCPQCGQRYPSDERWEDVDDIYICHKCARLANVCEMSGAKTFGQLIEVLNNNNEEVNVHPKVAEGMAKCSSCQKPHAISVDIGDGEIICNDCVETLYTECEACFRLVPDSTLYPLGSKDYCTKCVEEAHILPFDEEEIELIMEAKSHEQKIA